MNVVSSLLVLCAMLCTGVGVHVGVRLTILLLLLLLIVRLLRTVGWSVEAGFAEEAACKLCYFHMCSSSGLTLVLGVWAECSV